MRLRRRPEHVNLTLLGPAPSLSINGYAVHLDQQQAPIGGLTAYAAVDHRGFCDLVAVVAPKPRLRVLAELQRHWIPGLLTPVADGPSDVGHLIICRRPRGGALNTGHAWSEDDLLYRLLRPIARCLAQLHLLDMVHGAIHPSNLFGGGPDDVVSLGGGWANSPFSGVAAAYRPSGPASAAAHGPQDVNADIHALGVTLLTLLTGATPRTDLDDASLLRERQRHGTPATLLSGAEMSPALGRLLSAMLADDPARRPPAAALVDPCLLMDVPWMPVGVSTSADTTRLQWRGALPLGRVDPSGFAS